MCAPPAHFQTPILLRPANNCNKSLLHSSNFSRIHFRFPPQTHSLAPLIHLHNHFSVARPAPLSRRVQKAQVHNQYSQVRVPAPRPSHLPFLHLSVALSVHFLFRISRPRLTHFMAYSRPLRPLDHSMPKRMHSHLLSRPSRLLSSLPQQSHQRQHQHQKQKQKQKSQSKRLRRRKKV